MTQHIDKRNWTYRRFAVYGSLVLSFIIIGVSAFLGGESAVRIAAISTMGWVIALVLVTYVIAPTLEMGWGVLQSLLTRWKGGGDDSGHGNP